MVTVGGKNSKDMDTLQDTSRDIFESDKRRIVGLVVETLVNLIMSTHLLARFVIQSDWGPIGLRSTACLAYLIMKILDL